MHFIEMQVWHLSTEWIGIAYMKIFVVDNIDKNISNKM